MQVPRDNRRSILLPLAFFILTLAITWVLEPRKMRQVPLCSSLRERHPCLLQVNISTQHYLLLTPFPCRWSWPHYVCVHTQTCPTLVTPWTVPYQAHLSMGFSRQEYWSGLSFPSPGDLPDPGTEPGSPAPQADFFTDWATRETPNAPINLLSCLAAQAVIRRLEGEKRKGEIGAFISPADS